MSKEKDTGSKYLNTFFPDKRGQQSKNQSSHSDTKKLAVNCKCDTPCIAGVCVNSRGMPSRLSHKDSLSEDKSSAEPSKNFECNSGSEDLWDTDFPDDIAELLEPVGKHKEVSSNISVESSKQDMSRGLYSKPFGAIKLPESQEVSSIGNRSSLQSSSQAFTTEWLRNQLEKITKEYETAKESLVAKEGETSLLREKLRYTQQEVEKEKLYIQNASSKEKAKLEGQIMELKKELNITKTNLLLKTKESEANFKKYLEIGSVNVKEPQSARPSSNDSESFRKFLIKSEKMSKVDKTINNERETDKPHFNTASMQTQQAVKVDNIGVNFTSIFKTELDRGVEFETQVCPEIFKESQLEFNFVIPPATEYYPFNILYRDVAEIPSDNFACEPSNLYTVWNIEPDSSIKRTSEKTEVSRNGEDCVNLSSKNEETFVPRDRTAEQETIKNLKKDHPRLMHLGKSRYFSTLREIHHPLMQLCKSSSWENRIYIPQVVDHIKKMTRELFVAICDPSFDYYKSTAHIRENQILDDCSDLSELQLDYDIFSPEKWKGSEIFVDLRRGIGVLNLMCELDETCVQLIKNTLEVEEIVEEDLEKIPISLRRCSSCSKGEQELVFKHKYVSENCSDRYETHHSLFSKTIPSIKDKINSGSSENSKEIMLRMDEIYTVIEYIDVVNPSMLAFDDEEFQIITDQGVREKLFFNNGNEDIVKNKVSCMDDGECGLSIDYLDGDIEVIDFYEKEEVKNEIEMKENYTVSSKKSKGISDDISEEYFDNDFRAEVTSQTTTEKLLFSENFKKFHDFIDTKIEELHLSENNETNVDLTVCSNSGSKTAPYSLMENICKKKEKTFEYADNLTENLSVKDIMTLRSDKYCSKLEEEFILQAKQNFEKLKIKMQGGEHIEDSETVIHGKKRKFNDDGSENSSKKIAVNISVPEDRTVEDSVKNEKVQSENSRSLLSLNKRRDLRPLRKAVKDDALQQSSEGKLELDKEIEMEIQKMFNVDDNESNNRNLNGSKNKTPNMMIAFGRFKKIANSGRFLVMIYEIIKDIGRKKYTRNFNSLFVVIIKLMHTLLTTEDTHLGEKYKKDNKWQFYFAVLKEILYTRPSPIVILEINKILVDTLPLRREFSSLLCNNAHSSYMIMNSTTAQFTKGACFISVLCSLIENFLNEDDWEIQTYFVRWLSYIYLAEKSSVEAWYYSHYSTCRRCFCIKILSNMTVKLFDKASSYYLYCCIENKLTGRLKYQLHEIIRCGIRITYVMIEYDKDFVTNITERYNMFLNFLHTMKQMFNDPKQFPDLQDSKNDAEIVRLMLLEEKLIGQMNRNTSTQSGETVPLFESPIEWRLEDLICKNIFTSSYVDSDEE